MLKKSKATHPRQHGYEHHVLYTIASEEERYQQDTKGLRYLGQGYQHIGMLDTERSLIFGQVAEVRQEGIGKTVGNLQCDSEQHGEDEKYGHLSLSEQGKCPETHSVHQ